MFKISSFLLILLSLYAIAKEHIVYQQEITSKNVHTCEIPQREGNRLALDKGPKKVQTSKDLHIVHAYESHLPSFLHAKFCRHLPTPSFFIFISDYVL